MFQEFLFQISKINIAINGRIEEDGDQLINTLIFGQNFEWDVFAYKKTYFQRLARKELGLLSIQESVYAANLSPRERTILLQEIENRLIRIEFLRYIYNTEAQKIDERVVPYYPYSIEIYNKAFFGVTKKDIGEHLILEDSHVYPNVYSKAELVALIEAARAFSPELIFKFGKFSNMSHMNWVLKIPNQKYYNLQNIITLFFHETTHFFRTFNGARNLGFPFQFAGYLTLEEWIAIYNEYLYGNKICDYGAFVPYYNLCIQALQQDISETEKKQRIYEILSCKGFDQERSNQFYNRFYKYCRLGGTHLFLKDLIYYNGYKNIKKLLRKNPQNYEKIMAGDIGIKELEQWLVPAQNNYDHKGFFQYMVKEVKKVLK